MIDTIIWSLFYSIDDSGAIGMSRRRSMVAIADLYQLWWLYPVTCLFIGARLPLHVSTVDSRTLHFWINVSVDRQSSTRQSAAVRLAIMLASFQKQLAVCWEVVDQQWSTIRIYVFIIRVDRKLAGYELSRFVIENCLILVNAQFLSLYISQIYNL
jgi:hypothetical protein